MYLITGINESESLTKPVSYGCKYKFDDRIQFNAKTE